MRGPAAHPATSREALDKRAALYTLYSKIGSLHEAGGRDATCYADADLWDASDTAGKQLMCAKCPVRKFCRAVGEADPENTFGVWGGVRFPRTKGGAPGRRGEL
jgi:hypothetical protein